MVIFLLIIHDGHLNLAQSGHYNFAVTLIVRAIYLMLNNHIVADNFRFSVATLLHVMLTIKRLSQSRILGLSTA